MGCWWSFWERITGAGSSWYPIRDLNHFLWQLSATDEIPEEDRSAGAHDRRHFSSDYLALSLWTHGKGAHHSREQAEKQNCSKLQQKAKEQREKGQGLSCEQQAANDLAPSPRSCLMRVLPFPINTTNSTPSLQHTSFGEAFQIQIIALFCLCHGLDVQATMCKADTMLGWEMVICHPYMVITILRAETRNLLCLLDIANQTQDTQERYFKNVLSIFKQETTNEFPWN